MTTEIAKIGLGADSSQVKEATKDLDALGNAAENTEKKVERSRDALGRFVTEANKAEGASTKMTAAQKAAAQAADQQARAIEKSIYNYQSLTNALKLSGVELERYNAVRKVGLSMDSELGNELRKAAEGYYEAAQAAKELASIEEARSKHRAQQSQQNWNMASGINMDEAYGQARRSAQVFEEMYRQQDILDRKTRELRAAIDPMGTAFENMNVSIKDANEVMAAGRISAEEYAIAINHARSAYLNYAQTIDGTKANMQAQAAQRAQTTQSNWDMVYGFGNTSKSASDSAAVFQQNFKAQDDFAARVKAFRAELYPLSTAAETMNQKLKEANALYKAGAITLMEQNEAVSKAKAAYLDYQGAVTGALEREKALAAHRETASQQDLADIYGFNRQSKSAYDSASVFQDNFAEQDKLAAQATEILNKINPLQRATDSLVAEMLDLDNLFKRGYLSADQYARAVDYTKQKFDELRRSIDGTREIERLRQAQNQASAQVNFNNFMGVNPTSGAGNAQASAAVFEEAANRQDRLTQATIRWREQLDPVKRIEREVAAGTKELNELLAEGYINTEEYARGLKLLEGGFDKAGAAAKRLSDIERGRADAVAQNMQRFFNQYTGVDRGQLNPGGYAFNQTNGINSPGQAPSTAAQSAEVFMEQQRAIEATERSMEDLANRATRLRSAMDPLYSSEMKMTQAIREANALYRANVLSLTERDKVIQQATDNHERFRRNMAGEEGGLRGYQFQNLGYQVNDVITSLTSGISPMQTLFQQGPQIYQILGDAPGGMAAGLKSAASAAWAYVTPLNVLIATLGTFAIAAAAAQNAFAKTQIQAYRSTETAQGLRSGANISTVNQTANDNYQAAGLSRGEARSFVSALAGQGIDPSLYAEATRQIKAYALTVNQDLDKAFESYAKNLGSGAQGLRNFDEALNNNSGGLDRQIEKLMLAGERTKAMQLIQESLNGTLGKTAQLQTGWERIWDKITKPVKTGFDVMGEMVDGYYSGRPEDPTASQRRQIINSQIGFEQQRITNAEGSMGTLFGWTDDSKRAAIADAKSKIEGLKKALQDLDAQDAKKTADAKNRFESKEIKDYIESINPAIKKIEDLEAVFKRLDEEKKKITSGELNIGSTATALASINTIREALVQLKADAAAGGAGMFDALRNVNMESRVQNFGDYAKKVEEIKNNFEQGKANAARTFTNDAAGFLNQVKSLEEIRDKQLKIAETQVKIDAGSKGGAFNLVPDNLKPFFTSAAQRTGAPVDLIAAISKSESAFRVNADANINFPESHAYGLMQLQPRTAAGLGVRQRDPADNVYGGAKLIQQERDYFNDDALALWAYKRGRKFVTDRDSDISRANPEDRAYIAKILKDANTPATTAKNQIEGLDANTKQLEQQKRALEDATKYEGKSIEKLDAANYINQELTKRIQDGMPISQAMIEVIKQNSAAFASNEQARRAVTLGAQLDIDRANIGRDAITAAGYSTVRGAGIDPDSAAGGVLREQVEMNEKLKIIKGTGDEVFKGMLSDIRSMKNPIDIAFSAANKLLDKVTQIASDQIWSAITGGAGANGGGFTGAFKSLFGIGGGSDSTPTSNFAGQAAGAIGPFPMLNGGVMTPFGPLPLRTYARGGIGRAGEPQLAVFAEGSHNEAYVPLPDGRSIPVSMKDNGAANQNNGGSIHVYPSPGDKAEVKKTQTPQGPRTEIVMTKAVSDMMQSGEMDSVMFRRYGIRATG